MKKHIIILLLIFTTVTSWANTINVNNSSSLQEVLTSSYVFKDNTQHFTISDILKNNINFEKNNQSRLSFGYSPDFNVWLKFTLKNTSNKNVTKILEYANPLTTHLTLYDTSTNTKSEDGLFQINEKRRTVNPYFYIYLKPKQSKTFYLKASSSITTMIIQLKLWEEESFFNNELKHQSILQLFFGAILVLLVYNLFVFFFTRDISYLYYVLYLLGVIIHQLAYTGIWDVYLLSQTAIINSINMASVITLFPVIALALFIKSFLSIEQYPKISFVLNLCLILVVTAILIFLTTPEFNNIRNLPSMILVVYLIFITVYASFKRNRQAYFILAGWILIATATLLMYLNSIGVFNIYSHFTYFIEFAFIAEALLFSIALADRINHLQHERDNITQQFIIHQQTEKDRLEAEVTIKTEELRLALKEQTTLLHELNHRVKNNMQTIISLIQLQSDEINDENIQDIFLTIQNRIKAMSYLHELLYQKSNISYVNAYEYFETMIDNLQDSFEKEVEIIYKININLEVSTAISCGLILNELVINSFKYAFEKKEEEGKILVELYKTGDTYYFNVSDNGSGYDVAENESSFGLVLVKSLVEEHLNGYIVTTGKNGVKNQIVWSEYA